MLCVSKLHFYELKHLTLKMLEQFYLITFCNHALLVKFRMKLCTTGSLTFTLGVEGGIEERKGGEGKHRGVYRELQNHRCQGRGQGTVALI